MTFRINYNELELGKLKLIKDETKKVTHYFHYDNHKEWQLKCPKAEIIGNLIKNDNYSTIDISYPSNHECLKLLSNIDQKVCNTDKMLQTVKYSNGSFILRLRINDNTKFYDRDGKFIDLKDFQLKTLLEPKPIMGLILKLENVRIGQDISKCNWYIDQIRLSFVPKGINDCDISDSDSDYE